MGLKVIIVKRVPAMIRMYELCASFVLAVVISRCWLYWTVEEGGGLLAFL